MAKGNTLALVTTMVKNHSGRHLTVGTSDDTRIHELIEEKQMWLASNWDWQHLKDSWEVALAAGDRLKTEPATDVYTQTIGINWDRPVLVETLYNGAYLTVDYGIGTNEYNLYNSASSEAADPVQRWQLYQTVTPATKYEVWPIPQTAQTLRFTGQRMLATLRNGSGVLTTTLKLDLDDQLVALYVASELLMRENSKDAAAKLALAQERFHALRAGPSTEKRTFRLGSCDRDIVRPIKIVTIAS